MKNSRFLASGLSLLKVQMDTSACIYLMFQSYNSNNYVASNPYSSTMIALLVSNPNPSTQKLNTNLIRNHYPCKRYKQLRKSTEKN